METKTNRKKNILAVAASTLALLLLVGFAAPVGTYAAEETPDESTAVAAPGTSSISEEDITLYTIYYYNQDGTLFSSAQAAAGAEVPAPAAQPALEGFVFTGWYAEGATAPFAFTGSVLSGDLALYAGFEEVPAAPASVPAPSAVISAIGATVQSGSTPAAPSNTHTVTFVANNETYATQSVLNETLVILPATPVGSEAFLGWYTAAGTAFDPQQLITEDMTLTAKFSNTTVLVTYLNTDGTILEVVEGTLGQTAPAPSASPSLEMGTELQHWALAGSTDAFTAPLTGNVTLVPVYTTIALAVFVTNGSEVEPQTGADGFAATRPQADPTRNGYTFAGWSSNEAGTDTFDFESSAIHGTQFIYAKWQADTASYTININVEKANVKDPGDPLQGGRANYEIKYTTVLSGLTGEEVSLTDEEARAAAAAAGEDVTKLLTYSTFKASETCAISGNGDTVINVYYTRTVFTFDFDTTAAMGEIVLPNGDNVGSTYTLAVKLGQDISAVWPAQVLLPEGTYFNNWSSYYSNNALYVSYSYISVAFSAPVALQTNPYYYTVSTPRRDRVTLTPKTTTKVPYTETRVYYVELTDAEKETFLATGSLPGETVRTWTTDNATYGGTRYYKWAETSGTNNQNNNPATSYGGWPGREIAGFETVGSTSGIVRASQFVEPQLNSGKDYTLYYYMPRKANTLTLVTGNGTIVNPSSDLTKGNGSYTATVKSGESISGLLPTEVTLSGRAFDGWYTDETYAEAFTGSVMPGDDLVLYARYRGTDVAVTYVDGENIITRTYATGEKLIAHDLAGTAYAGAQKGDVIPGKGIFMGWYYEVGSGAQKATVEFPLGLALTRSTYVLKAQLLPQTYAVAFKGDEGGAELVTYTTQQVKSGQNTLARSGHTAFTPVARTGYTFAGWSTVRGGTSANFTTATRILADTTVYAIWTLSDVTVAYHANGGASTAAAQTVQYGQSLRDAALALPGENSVTRSGYRFTGWSMKATGGQAFTAATVLTKDITVYAQWAPVSTSSSTSGSSTPSSSGTPAASDTSATSVTSGTSAVSTSAGVAPAIVISGEGSVPPSGGTPSAEAAVRPAADAEAIVSTVDTMTAQDNTLPLGGIADSSVWSLLSLMMAVASAAVSVLLIMSLFKKNDEQPTDVKKASAKEWRVMIMKAGAILLGVVTGVLFLVLDDASLPMALLNQGTLWIAIPFVASFLLLAVQAIVNRKKTSKKDNEKTNSAPRSLKQAAAQA